ncbi:MULTISPECIES: YitT family protein [unclassified Psychrobacillus]|uniref:YitT family protein n=1 Tax=unclassified Psychrobacillus TaxID=2636677 RepID=UPI00146DCFDA|nr:MULTISPECIES: YitT family protein [unclassified Psychrobacillus]MCM3358789.1 YitT family protein [Psychrobacillus sp. MER TA 171]NME05832.1 YitT family protein [Psychrobacillus sp. BL-248-WT-3]
MGIGLKLKNILMIILGSAIFSFGFVHFNMQNELGEGGFSGITLILYFVFHLDVSVMNLVLNIPMFILGWKLLGRRVFYYTLIGTFSVSVFLKISQIYEIQLGINDDLFLASLFAGVFIGVGLGIIFRAGGTTGGVDIIARLAQKYLGWSMGKTMFMFDAVVIMVSWLTFLDIRSMMYTLVAVFVGARVIDFVQEGAYAARGAFIISDHQDAIANRITNEMDRGVTVLKGYGHYTKKDREVLYCVISKNEIIRLKTIISSVDPHAFVSVTEMNDVMGEGFTLDEQKKPLL